MARRKETPPPLLSVKHDFVSSLDAFMQAGLNFLQAAETALQLGAVSGPAGEVLRERADAFRGAMFSEDEAA